MDEISNKTLTVLIAIAIVISLGSTFISLNRLSKLSGMSITGLATSGSGKANLTVSSATSIAVSGAILFGSGIVNASSALLESNASDYRARYGNGTWSWAARGSQTIKIENDGNVNVTINVSTNVSRANYTGSLTGSLFSAAISAEEAANACSGFGTGAVQRVAWTEINNTRNITLCRNLSPTDTGDRINISVRLKIRENVPARTSTALLTFFGYTYT